MEKHFTAPDDALPEKTNSSSKRSVFSDSALPSVVDKAPVIRQASTDGIWDQPFMVADADPKPLDWGAGLPGISSSVAPSFPNGIDPPGNGTTPNPFQSGFGFGTSNAYSSPNRHFNTESRYNASPSAYPPTNSPMMFDPNSMPMGYGQGYFDPSTGQVYAYPPGLNAQAPQPQVAGMNPYAMNGMTGFGVNPYYGNQFGTFQGGMSPGAGMGMHGMGMNAEMQNSMTLQAWYQQELLRHQRSLQQEEEAEARATEAEEAARSEWTSKRLMPVKVSSPLAETLWSGVKTMSVFNTPDGPDRGVGMPLANRSWLDRPYYVGLFVGNMWGSKLVSGMIDQDDGGNGGMLLGYNFNEYWGVESRLHFASLDIYETAEGVKAYEDLYREINELPADASVPPLTSRSHNLTMFDFSVHYYPLGNAKWRPFFKYGLGISRGSFKDTYGTKHTAESITMPIGFGLRYWWNERLAIQADIVDNMIFSKGIAKTQNNWTLGIGISYAFGTGKKRRPVPYWPYTPSTGSKF